MYSLFSRNIVEETEKLSNNCMTVLFKHYTSTMGDMSGIESN